MAAKRSSRIIAGQMDLFGEEEPPPLKGAVLSAPSPSQLSQLATGLGEYLWLGTSSWSFPGWNGVVYGARYSESKLAKQGLRAYAQHPLLRAVGLDRTYYASISREAYQEYALAVPSHFRFLVKAPEALTVLRFPQHPRYGAQGGQSNPHFLSREMALRELVEPALVGLGDKLGCLLFQFPPQSMRELGGPRGFATRLYHFFEELPRGLPYAVELRNRDLFCPSYRDVLDRLDISHCLNIHPHMADLSQQAEAAQLGRLSIMRWMLNPRLETYDEAVDRLAPFDRLQEEDLLTRVALARLCREHLLQQRPTMVIINNKAEGCAPLSVRALAECIVTPPPFE